MVCTNPAGLFTETDFKLRHQASGPTKALGQRDKSVDRVLANQAKIRKQEFQQALQSNLKIQFSLKHGAVSNLSARDFKFRDGTAPKSRDDTIMSLRYLPSRIRAEKMEEFNKSRFGNTIFSEKDPNKKFELRTGDTANQDRPTMCF